MPRFGSIKTYSRSSHQDLNTTRSKAFDNALSQESRPSISMAASKTTKWGQTCFTRRSHQEDDHDLKRRKVDSSYSMSATQDLPGDDDGDPFSFDCGESKKMSAAAAKKKQSKLTKANSYSSSYTGGSGLTLRVSRGNSDKTLDSNKLFKSSYGKLSDYNNDLDDKPEKVAPIRTKYKFFTSKKKGLTDHNYSQDLETDNLSISSSISDNKVEQTDTVSLNSVHSISTPTTKNSTQENFGFDLDEDSDDGIPDIFSSSKKSEKKLRAQEIGSLFEDFDDNDSIGSATNSQDYKSKLDTKGSLQKRLSNKLSEMESQKRNTLGGKKNGGATFTRRLLMSPKKVSFFRVYHCILVFCILF